MKTRFNLTLLASVLTVAVTLLVLAFYWHNEAEEVELRRQAEFSDLADRLAERIVHRLADYEFILRGVRAFYDGSENVSPDEFRHYFDVLGLSAEHSELRAVVFLAYVAEAEKAAHEARMRALGVLDYAIVPSGKRPFYAPLVLGRSFAAALPLVVGEDLAVSPAFAVLEESRFAGQAALATMPGFAAGHATPVPGALLMSLPVYARQVFLGWVGGVFFLDELLSGLTARHESPADIDICIYAGPDAQSAALLYGQETPSPESPRRTERRIVFSGANWLLVVRSTASFEARVPEHEPWLVLAGGVPLAFLLGALVWVLGSGHRRALALAEKMTAGLRVAQSDLEATLNAIPDIIVEIGTDERICRYKDSSVWMPTQPVPNMVGRSLAEAFPAEVAGVMREALQEARQYGLSLGRQYALPCGGGRRWYEISVARKEAADGQAAGFVVLAREITARRQDEARLQLFASVFSHAREGIIICQSDHHIVEVNDSFCRITGFSREEVLGQPIASLLSDRPSPEMRERFRRDIVTKGFHSGEQLGRRKNGESYHAMFTVSAVRDAKGAVEHYVNLFSDISALKESQQRLEHIGHYDALTDMPNRILLADRLKQALAQRQRCGGVLAVAYLDLDGFKEINDAHGHEIGDNLLVAVVQHMKAALRDGDTLARIGGDEFVIVLADLEGMEDVEIVLRRLLHAASTPVVIDRQELRVSASIGVTLCPRDGSDADQLIRHADQAMYKAKQSGKNCYHFFDVAYENALRVQHENLARLQQALEGDEFVLYYQPKVNMRSGAVIGAEALIYWQDPARGLLSPAQFLPLIEGQPFDARLGEWVIDTALKQMAAWQEEGLYLPVSVNVSAYHVQQRGFVKRLEALLGGCRQVDARQLELEILESGQHRNMVRLRNVMHASLRLGVSFSLDDFGTGYSSLSYLKHLPSATLKIDQSFVRDFLDDPNDLAIVAGVIGLARAFHRQVIAEGVESVAHGVQLLALGCECAQGFGIARPMPASELPGWIAHWQPDPAWRE